MTPQFSYIQACYFSLMKYIRTLLISNSMKSKITFSYLLTTLITIEMVENFYIRNQLIKTNRLIYLMTKSHKKMKKSKISLYLELHILYFDFDIQFRI